MHFCIDKLIQLCYCINTLSTVHRCTISQKGGAPLLSINYKDGRPIYEQVKEGLRKLITTAAIKEGEKLPSVRELASSLAINPNTIQRAYKELEAEGYIYSSAGKGSFVSSSDETVLKRRMELTEQLNTIISELGELGISKDDIISHIKGGQTL